MQYRRFGKTGAVISALGFGCMRLPLIPGGNNSQIDEEATEALVNQAIEAGVNYFDTAYVYHSVNLQKGESEPVMGRILEKVRSRFYIATKFPCWFLNDESDYDRILNDQLARLRTDHIDFYLIHNINHTNWDKLKNTGYKAFLDRALADKRIRNAGFSFHDKYDLFTEIVDDYDWSFCQIQLNYLDEEYQAGRNGLHYAAAKDMGVIVMEPLRGGRLGENLPTEAQALFDKAGVSPAEMALRWVLNESDVSFLLSGMNRKDHLEQNVNACFNAVPGNMSPDDLELIAKAKKIFDEKIKVPCTTCGYCMPCPNGVDIPTSFRCYNNSFVFDQKDPSYENFLGMGQRASACIECGTCEPLCPQGIEIINDLKKVAEYYGS
jgi:predicted aldo/keto reductase-like oxidoreductase